MIIFFHDVIFNTSDFKYATLDGNVVTITTSSADLYANFADAKAAKAGMAKLVTEISKHNNPEQKKSNGASTLMQKAREAITDAVTGAGIAISEKAVRSTYDAALNRLNETGARLQAKLDEVADTIREQAAKVRDDAEKEPKVHEQATRNKPKAKSAKKYNGTDKPDVAEVVEPAKNRVSSVLDDNDIFGVDRRTGEKPRSTKIDLESEISIGELNDDELRELITEAVNEVSSDARVKNMLTFMNCTKLDLVEAMMNLAQQMPDVKLSDFVKQFFGF